MNIEKIIAIIVVIITHQASTAQINLTHSINSGGISWNSNNYSLGCTVGEIVIPTLINSTSHTIGGFLSTTTFLISNVDDKSNSTNSVSVYPNPTLEQLHLNINRELSTSYEIKIYNQSGALIFHESYSENQTNLILNLIDYPNGIYLVSCIENGQNTIGTFKVVKHND